MVIVYLVLHYTICIYIIDMKQCKNKTEYIILTITFHKQIYYFFRYYFCLFILLEYKLTYII